jgi:ABC-type sugar transport system ATPase subunit
LEVEVAMAEIRIESLRKVFRGSVAVRDLSLVIQDKELLVILGPTGCGKTTTLNCIAGLERPTSGRVLFDGEDVTDWPPHRRNIAMVFQSCLLYPHLTARDNILISLRKTKVSKEEAENRLEQVSSLLQIEKLLAKLPSQMSGGERQRVATAKAIVCEPTVFLMDEPLANLDARHREVLRAETVNLQKRLGTTMVVVTHDQAEAMTMADKIAVMRDGTLEQVGSPDEIYNQPANRFVAEFVGSPAMNFFEGAIRQGAEGLEFARGDFAVRLPARLATRLHDRVGKPIVIGARPQHMSCQVDARQGTLKASVFAVERMGKESVIIATGDQVGRIKISTTDVVTLGVGDPIWVTADPEHVRLFDPENEKNIEPGG